MKGSQCPGSDQLPSFTQVDQTSGAAQGTSDSGCLLDPTNPDDPSNPPHSVVHGFEFLLGGSRPLLIEHIPKSARPACCTLLTKLLNEVCKDPSNCDRWAELLAIGPAVFGKPYRVGAGAMLVSSLSNELWISRDQKASLSQALVGADISPQITSQTLQPQSQLR